MQNKRFLWLARHGSALVCFATGLYAGLATASSDPFQQLPQLTPERLIETVLKQNPDIPAMEAALKVASARIGHAQALDDPILTYAVAPQTANANKLDFGQNITISQGLPWPGKRELRANAARFESDAAGEGITQARLKLTSAAKVAFADWYFVHAAINVNAINKSLLQELRNIAEIKYSAGRASKQDALRAEVESALLEHRDIELERQRKEVLVSLNTLLQRQPDAALPPPSALPDASNALPTAAELRAAALQARPELRALDARIQADRQRLALAEQDTLPDFKLSAGYNSLWMRDEQRFTVGIGINLPLSPKHNAAKDEARADLMRLDFTQRGLAAQLAGEVQRAYDRTSESRHVLALYQDKLLPLAEENLAAARADYESGRGNFLDVVGAEKNLMQVRLQLEQARADLFRRLAALELSVGGPQALQGMKNEGTNP